MANETLSTKFIEEIFRLCFLKKSIVERLQDNLKYQYLPTPELKQIYKDIVNHYKLNNTIPTFGVIYEKNKNDDKVLHELNKIRDCDIVDPMPVLKQLEDYIKNVRFKLLWEDVIEIHKAGDYNKAIQTMSKESTDIVEFSIFSGSSKFLYVFNDFQSVQLEKSIRKEEQIDRTKIPFGILPLDTLSEGGMDRKDTLLWIMRSGVGKSTVLKWQGMYACRLGYDVLHIQLEGSEEEVYDKYTQVWSALSYGKVKNGNIEGDEYEKLLSVARQMVVNNQDIAIRSFEQFDEASMLDIRDCVVEYIKEKGKAPDVLIVDSIDLCHPGDGLHYGVDTQSIKMKLNNSSRKFKNLCNEFDMRGITATQTSDVKIDIWNDPDKVITRSDSMGDKNIANSYSFVLTGNQTLDEEKRRVMRIYCDKFRYYDPSTRVYPIATNYATGRFYDNTRTLKVYKDIYEKNV